MEYLYLLKSWQTLYAGVLGPQGARALPPASSPAARSGLTGWEEPPACGRGTRPLRATVGCNGGSQLRQHVGDCGSFFVLKCNHS